MRPFEWDNSSTRVSLHFSGKPSVLNVSPSQGSSHGFIATYWLSFGIVKIFLRGSERVQRKTLEMDFHICADSDGSYLGFTKQLMGEQFGAAESDNASTMAGRCSYSLRKLQLISNPTQVPRMVLTTRWRGRSQCRRPRFRTR